MGNHNLINLSFSIFDIIYPNPENSFKNYEKNKEKIKDNFIYVLLWMYYNIINSKYSSNICLLQDPCTYSFDKFKKTITINIPVKYKNYVKDIFNISQITYIPLKLQNNVILCLSITIVKVSGQYFCVLELNSFEDIIYNKNIKETDKQNVIAELTKFSVFFDITHNKKSYIIFNIIDTLIVLPLIVNNKNDKYDLLMTSNKDVSIENNIKPLKKDLINYYKEIQKKFREEDTSRRYDLLTYLKFWFFFKNKKNQNFNEYLEKYNTITKETLRYILNSYEQYNLVEYSLFSKRCCLTFKNNNTYNNLYLAILTVCNIPYILYIFRLIKSKKLNFTKNDKTHELLKLIYKKIFLSNYDTCYVNKSKSASDFHYTKKIINNDVNNDVDDKFAYKFNDLFSAIFPYELPITENSMSGIAHRLHILFYRFLTSQENNFYKNNLLENFPQRITRLINKKPNEDYSRTRLNRKNLKNILQIIIRHSNIEITETGPEFIYFELPSKGDVNKKLNVNLILNTISNGSNFEYTHLIGSSFITYELFSISFSIKEKRYYINKNYYTDSDDRFDLVSSKNKTFDKLFQKLLLTLYTNFEKDNENEFIKNFNSDFKEMYKSKYHNVSTGKLTSYRKKYVDDPELEQDGSGNILNDIQPGFYYSFSDKENTRINAIVFIKK